MVFGVPRLAGGCFSEKRIFDLRRLNYSLNTYSFELVFRRSQLSKSISQLCVKSLEIFERYGKWSRPPEQLKQEIVGLTAELEARRGCVTGHLELQFTGSPSPALTINELLDPSTISLYRRKTL